MTSDRPSLSHRWWLLWLVLAATLTAGARELVRPEPVGSMRNLWREPAAYQELNRLWREWNAEYPSESAYENWMYAARYAGDPAYTRLLEKGRKRYPGSAVLLYLSAVERVARHEPRERIVTLEMLRRSAALDPTYDDPWFALVVELMALDRKAEVRQALGKLVELGAVDDATLDYCHNMLACLEPGAVLVTNGDLDTFPCWILQEVSSVRPDVTVLNQSLLNTDWYAARHGRPAGPGDWNVGELAELRAREMPCSDTLLERIIRQAARDGREVCFATTLAPSPRLRPLMDKGAPKGLATRVQPDDPLDGAAARELAACWLESFRTTGLDSWSFRGGDPRRASRQLAGNYASVLVALLEALPAGDRHRSALFAWYRDHLAPGLDESVNRALAPAWDGVPEAGRWLRGKGWTS
jgi:hypothetical protein